MSDRPESTRPPEDAAWWHLFVCGEVMHAAGQLRALGHRLETLSKCLPLPPDDVVERVLEAASSEAFAGYPVLSLYADLQVLASSKLFDLAMALEEAAVTNAPEPGVG